MGQIVLRDYQQQLKNDVYNKWLNGSRSCIAVLPTGGGKSYVLASIVKDAPGYALIFAHRDVLIEQLSVSLAEMGVHHSFICSNATRTGITNTHYEKFNQSFYDDTPNARVYVVSVDTFLAWKKAGKLPTWLDQVGLAVFDEAHHIKGAGQNDIEATNKWGICAQHMPRDCKILGMTATPCRSDRKGMGIDNDGIFDSMVVGPDLRYLIDIGSLCDYKIFTPPQAHEVRKQVKQLTITASGDYNATESTAIVDTKTITGDVVQTYLDHTGGKYQGITFAASIKHAEHLAKAYNDAGVHAAAISSNTKPGLRRKLVKAFKAGELMQLVNVDLFGEGFDVPAIYCVSFVRPTLSYSLYMQHFGRALRLLPGKEFALIFDHVANVYEHRLPDHGRPWTLDAPPRKNKNVESDYELMTCSDCDLTYELPAPHCPDCGPKIRTVTEREYQIEDGELIEMTDEQLKVLRGQRNNHDRDKSDIFNGMVADGASRMIAHSVANNHDKRKDAQTVLRTSMHDWWERSTMPVGQAREQFAQIFKIDVHSAQVLNYGDSVALNNRLTARVS